MVRAICVGGPKDREWVKASGWCFETAVVEPVGRGTGPEDPLPPILPWHPGYGDNFKIHRYVLEQDEDGRFWAWKGERGS